LVQVLQNQIRIVHMLTIKNIKFSQFRPRGNFKLKRRNHLQRISIAIYILFISFSSCSKHPSIVRKEKSSVKLLTDCSKSTGYSKYESNYPNFIGEESVAFALYSMECPNESFDNDISKILRINNLGKNLIKEQKNTIDQIGNCINDVKVLDSSMLVSYHTTYIFPLSLIYHFFGGAMVDIEFTYLIKLKNKCIKKEREVKVKISRDLSFYELMEGQSYNKMIKLNTNFITKKIVKTARE
jgi:hypothetical protein